MPQKTNLNINPYYDDFDKYNNFYRVLFKPGYPVQARELTTLQSILQNQVESFGSHIFKEGSMVIPGGITYDLNYYAIKINPDHLGIDVSLYIDKLVGVTLEGQSSGVTATVLGYLLPPDLGVETPTLYVKYRNSNNDAVFDTFNDKEVLITQSTITYGNTSINSGDTLATVFPLNASTIGSRVNLAAGVYFIRGTFVDVESSSVILDPYENTPSYRVGLTILEEIVSASDDNSLYDNAKGFSNYAAPGADRLKISAILSKKSLTDFDDKSFVELIRLDNGEVKKLQDKTQYSLIKDYFAKRTFEESGDYSIDNFKVEVTNSLNDRISSSGIYLENQKTDSGNAPSDSLMCVKVSPGKAYVRGFDIETVSTTILDVDKPRDTKTVSSALVPFELGSLVRVNNVYGAPFVGINNNNSIVYLQNRRKETNTVGSGTTIGQARVYTYNLTESPYTQPSTQWDLYLFDIQTYTVITLNTSLTPQQCPQSSFIRGASSGASGYVADSNTASTITLLQTSGAFIVGEQILINESTEFSRSIQSVKAYNADDIKSVYQNSTGITSKLKTTFTADLVLQKSVPAGFNVTDSIFIDNTGIATCAGKSFLGIRSDAIIRYQRPGIGTETYSRVQYVSSDGFTMKLVGISSVANVCNGDLPVGVTSTFNGAFRIGVPKIKQNDEASLYARLTSKDIATVNLGSSNILINNQLTEQSTSASGSLVVNVNATGISSAFFEAFDYDRYSVIYNDGVIESLRSDQFILDVGGTQLTINGLRVSQTNNVTLNTTVRKISVTNKVKQFLRSQKLDIVRTVSAASTALTGLSTNPYYGVRVEDKEISLNIPDVANVIAVYESLDQNAPILDKLTFVSGLNLDTATILGEKIVGSTSGAIAQLATRVSGVSGTQVEFVYLNNSKFQVGELATFKESNIAANIQGIIPGTYLNITDRYTLDKGQKEQYYDYSKIVRKTGSADPKRRLLAIYNRYDVPTNDTGDVFTVNSYPSERYTSDIPLLLNETVRASDALDFRPRVSDFNTYSSSPFAFTSRTFGNAASNTTPVLTPNESTLIGYSYYLPRIDKIVLNRSGEFTYLKGNSALNPKSPLNAEEAMEIATITLPAYLYSPKDASISLVDNRRYTMRDIGKLEDRIENLEKVTSLSLLEVDTKTLQIQDADGLSRFKSGFFVDDFKDNNLIDKSSKADINLTTTELVVPTDLYSLKAEIALNSSLNQSTSDFSTDLALLDPNVRKTGDLITLNYQEKGWIEQPLASRVENVNPFNMIEFVGTVVLRPSSDSWVRNVYVPGNTRQITGGSDYEYIENIKISTEPEQWMRSRNVEFLSGGLKPLTTYYTFLDGASNIDVIPKILEIQMNSGVFQIGEDVEGFIGATKIITFRVAKPNHKVGQYDDPSRSYQINPYGGGTASTQQTLPDTYSASSTVLTVDTASLASEAQGKYSGYVIQNAVLVGKTSKAQAKIINVRLKSDNFGDLLGCFFLRDPLTNPPPTIRIGTGVKTFKITSSLTNETPLPGSLLISSGETTYTSTGIVDTYRQDTVVVRRPPPPPPRGKGKDPLAQTFTVDETGAFLTSVDLFFASKDPVEKCYVQVRNVELGTPTNQTVQNFAGQVLEPSQVAISTNASVATRVTFPSPIYLEPRKEYAIVVLAPSTNNYELWIARMGEKTINSQFLPDAESVIVTKQYTGGSLFRSQNGTIWTANQFEDMKFKLYKANFTSSDGTAYFYNPELGSDDNNVPILLPNPIKTLPRKLKVGITTTVGNILSNVLVPGVKVSSGTQPGPVGYIEKIGGNVFGNPSITNAGIGYSSSGTFNNVPLYSITGSGNGATANIVFASNKVSSVAIASTGTGYVVGDVLGITTSSVVKGSGARLSVSTIQGIDTLYLTNVQGETFTTGDPLVYYSGSTSTSLGSTVIRGTTSLINELNDGKTFEITQFGHSMHSPNNIVEIQGVEPNTVPTKLSSAISSTETTISIASTIGLNNFEGISTSQGYVKINNEILYYTSITAGGAGAGSLGISSRGIDGSAIRSHDINDLVYKYELNGVSLTKINKIHNLPTDAAPKSANDMDKYYLQIDRSVRSTGNTQLSFSQESQIGGNNAKVSRNFQYDGISPQFNVIAPGQATSISAQMRTVSGTSAGGSEVSFQDQGFEPAQLNQVNFLPTTRIVCSKVNETTRLTNIPRNKSLTFGIRMQTTDPNLSPVIDTQNSVFTLRRSRLNKPISDYVLDGRVNSVDQDPHSAVYISNKVDLAQPATSLKVIVSACRNASADFRVLYRLFQSDSSGVEPSYELFPGYDNLIDTNGDGYGDSIIDNNLNNGKPDAFVKSSKDNQFFDYQFTIDQLSPFIGYQIKIVMNGTNEALPPRFKDLRTIALA